jgi:hypothetical protein
MFRKLFVDHPESVGESYLEHLGMAFGFGLRMIGGGLACLLHGLIPGLCKTSGSKMIACLHDEMVVHRRRTPPVQAVAQRQA